MPNLAWDDSNRRVRRLPSPRAALTNIACGDGHYRRLHLQIPHEKCKDFSSGNIVLSDAIFGIWLVAKIFGSSRDALS
jgi:hypothetical protein